MYARRTSWLDGDGQPPMTFLSFPSLKDPSAKRHTGELLAFVDYGRFVQWRDGRWRRRGSDYEAIKQRTLAAMLDFAEARFPGFKDNIELAELATPLTNEHFTAHVQGGIYGMPQVAARFAGKNAGWTRIRTHIENLFLTGADVVTSGVMGAFTGGVATVGWVPNGVSVAELAAAAGAKMLRAKLFGAPLGSRAPVSPEDAAGDRRAA
jgi:phytoene dehydrogenase-like protein